VTYTRDNGSTTPTLNGFCAFNGLQINDGTFKSSNLGMITGSPPIRAAASSLPSDDGGLDGVPLYDQWEFDLEGELFVDSADYVQSAIDDLRRTFNLAVGLNTMTFKSRGFTGTRRMSVRLNGQIVTNDPGKGRRKTRTRTFTIPLLAVDPRAYDDATLRTVVFNPGDTKTLTNDGNYPSPFIAEFDGTVTNPQFDGPGTAGFNRLRMLNFDGSDYTITSPHFVRISTYPSTPTGITALDDAGVSVYGKVANRSAGTISPGTSSWTYTATSGAGQLVLTYRDAWV
jgi:hypothetical protein